MATLHPRPALVELTVIANRVEVFLGKEGHPGRIGINYLEQLQLPTLPSLYRAMLAGADHILKHPVRSHFDAGFLGRGDGQAGHDGKKDG